MKKIMLSDIQKSINDYIEKYGDTEVFAIARNNNKDYEYTIAIENGISDKGIRIYGKEV